MLRGVSSYLWKEDCASTVSHCLRQSFQAEVFEDSNFSNCW